MIASFEEAVSRWRVRPGEMVWDLFNVDCDWWQDDALDAYASGPFTRVGMKACAGPGKSFVESMAAIHHLVCYGNEQYHPVGAAVSCTGANLRDNLWRELAGWVGRSEFLNSVYEVTGESFHHRKYQKTWRVAARSFQKGANAEEQGRTLSGLHGKWIIILIDEAGDMAPAVGRTAEQAMSNAEVCRILVAGNPTSQKGLLYYATVRWRSKWSVITITGDPDDPKRSPRISAEWAREQIAINGRDSAWVQAYILGEFPAGGINSLFPISDLEASLARKPEDDPYAQKRLGVDVARFGDDRTVIFGRQGLRTRRPVIMRSMRGHEIASRIALAVQNWKGVDVILVDVEGVGASTEDALVTSGFAPLPVHFGSKADDRKYANKRSEMYFRASEWLKRGGQLPNDPDLITELSEITYSFTGDGRWIVEPKDIIKKRIGQSPDIADAFVTTFATPDVMRDPVAVETGGLVRTSSRAKMDYDPLEDCGAGGRCVIDLPG